MALPAALRSRLRPKTEKTEPSTPASPTSNDQATRDSSTTAVEANDAGIKQATRMRKGFALSASFAYLVSLVFLILVSHTHA